MRNYLQIYHIICLSIHVFLLFFFIFILFFNDINKNLNYQYITLINISFSCIIISNLSQLRVIFMIKTKISSKLSYRSLCGTNDSFPFKHGNYCASSDGHYLSNIWAENIDHLNENDYFPDDLIEVLLFEENDTTYAYVIDDRIPENTLHQPYFCGIKTCISLLKYHHKVPDDKCLCDFNILSVTHRSHKGIVGKSCPECKKRLTFQESRKGVFRIQIQDQVKSGLRPDWALAYFENGIFKRIPEMTVVPIETILKVDDNPIHKFGSPEDQGGAIPASDFLFVGEIKQQ